jgi:scyllo-inositol 2-dehydrogenase (NADP+)
MGQGTLRLSIASSSLAADHALRYRIHGLQGSYRKTGLDVQEQQLRDGLSPSDPAFGVEPDAQWGQLVRGDSSLAEPVAAEGGQWREFYGGMRRSLEQDSAVPISAEEARRVLALIETARRSSEQAHRIVLDGTAALR